MKEYITDVGKMDHFLTQFVIPFAWHLAGALIVWVAGDVLIRASQRLLQVTLKKRAVDPTLINYARSTMGFILRILLVIAILDIFGIQTTSLSAIIAAAGVAVGVAWSGLLSNFAAGIFLILFRPFRVNDLISAAGVSGTVREIGIFATTIDNGENARIFIGNNKLFLDNIINFTRNPYRWANFKVQIAYTVDPFDAMERIRRPLSQIPGVLNSPEATSEIQEFNPSGITLVFGLPCEASNYDSVIAKGKRVIYHAIHDAKYPVPVSQVVQVQSL